MATTLPLEDSAGELRSRISGSVHTPDDAAFDALRHAWNRAFEHHPALIVVPESAADVAAAVRFASDRGLSVAIQTTGHGVARPAAGGLLLLTHRLTGVTVDGDAWTARIGGGATWGRALSATAALGLAPVLGAAPDTGAVGSVLGGGMGWLARKYGLAADHVRAMEIVAADGVIRRASPIRDTDLFWALRGGGAGSFGVVTAMEVGLVPVTSVYAGSLVYPATAARSVAEHYREWIETAPDELTAALALMTPLRSDPFGPAPPQDPSTVVRGAFIGPDDEGEALLRHWRTWRTPALDTWRRMSLLDIASLSGEPAEPAARLTTTASLHTLTDEVLAILSEAALAEGAPTSVTVELRHAGGVVAAPPEYASAYSHRQHTHVVVATGTVSAPEDRPILTDFLQRLENDLVPHAASGVYLDFLHGREKVRRSAEGFTPGDWDRLRAVKRQIDPENLFSHGIGVTP